MYLIQAEAYAKQSTPNYGKAKEKLLEVASKRNPDLDDNEIAEDQTVIDAIDKERKLELVQEGHRFFDVRRWMIAPQTESKTMHGIEITRATDGTKTWKEFDVRTHVWRPAMYFFPIPYNETVKSKDLLQNPYYN